MKKRILLVLPVLFLVWGQLAYAGFGVSPGRIDEDNLVPGSQFERVVYIVQGNPEVDLKVEAFIVDKEIQNWVTFENGTEFVIPAGVQQYPLKIVVTIPEKSEFGIFNTFLRINVIPEQAKNDGEVNIALGGRVDLRLTVGDDVIESYEITSIEILDIYENDEAAVSFHIKNTGNISVAPASASFELFDKFGALRLGFAQSEDFQPVPAFSESSQKLEFPIDVRFAPGEYWGHVRVFDDVGNILKEGRTVFDVREQTAAAKYMWHIAAFVILIILVLIIIGFFLYVRRKKTTRRVVN